MAACCRTLHKSVQHQKDRPIPFSPRQTKVFGLDARVNNVVSKLWWALPNQAPNELHQLCRPRQCKWLKHKPSRLPKGCLSPYVSAAWIGCALKDGGSLEGSVWLKGPGNPFGYLYNSHSQNFNIMSFLPRTHLTATIASGCELKPDLWEWHVHHGVCRFPVPAFDAGKWLASLWSGRLPIVHRCEPTWALCLHWGDPLWILPTTVFCTPGNLVVLYELQDHKVIYNQ